MADAIVSLYVKNLKDKTIAVSKSILSPKKGGLVHFYTVEQVRNIIRMEEENEVDIQTEIPQDIMEKVEESRRKKEARIEAANRDVKSSNYVQFDPSALDPDTISIETRGPNLHRDKRADTMHVDPDQTLPLEVRGIKEGFNETAWDPSYDKETIPLEVRGPSMKIPNWMNAKDAEVEADQVVQQSRTEENNENDEEKQPIQSTKDVVGETPYEQDPTKEDVENAGTVSEETTEEQKREEEQSQEESDSSSSQSETDKTKLESQQSEQENSSEDTSNNEELSESQVSNQTMKTSFSSQELETSASSNKDDSKESDNKNDENEEKPVKAFSNSTEEDAVKVNMEEPEKEKPEWYLSFQEVEDMTKQELIDWSEKVPDLKLAKSKTAAETKEAAHEFLSEKFEDHAE